MASTSSIDPEAAALAQAAKLALIEAEASRRQEWATHTQERNRLRAEIAALKENKGDSTSPPAKKARLSGPTAEAAPAPPQGLSRTEAYARYHDAEAALRAERDKTASLEASLAKLMGELQQKLPVYQERSSRLAA